ncbi:conserved hypothetical protein [Ricinus communis]|uniref:Uncharacterized protein n=1 Tax=Ricinus communis TaxID=3988 RepID=B9SHT4_RICCO|nr:conserved hypothetical protein [Ricinus communis]
MRQRNGGTLYPTPIIDIEIAGLGDVDFPCDSLKVGAMDWDIPQLVFILLGVGYIDAIGGCQSAGNESKSSNPAPNCASYLHSERVN